MTNKEIAKSFQFLGEIMELHGENPFKIRSYQNAYLTLRKLPTPLSEMDGEEIAAIKGVGSAIAGKIKELLDTGEMSTLKKYQDMTPPGVQEMLHIPGFGPKKIQVIWKQLGVESVGELLYACNENRLVELKGFGQKTQEDLRQKLEFFQKAQGKFLYADLEKEAGELLAFLQGQLPGARISLAGEMRRKTNIVEKIDFLIGSPGDILPAFDKDLLHPDGQKDGAYAAHSALGTPVVLHHCQPGEFGSKLFLHTAAKEFMEAFLQKCPGVDFRGLAEEAQVFEKASLPYLVPELREQAWALDKGPFDGLVEEKHIKGVVHAHTTYSDGINTLREMAEYARAKGYQYLGLTDHSKSAFYANGLKEDRLAEQWREVDALNAELAPFKIFKGIESDILSDGSLDYETGTLQQFDFIIASIHSNLNMDVEKATTRLIRAIENPCTTILGHPTGRLLLSRRGYPIHHEKVIEACAANGVTIELNANPYRQDLDWAWIQLALEKGVLIAVNPDAHSIGGIHDIHFGVLSARKGGLPADRCLTCFEKADFERFIRQK